MALYRVSGGPLLKTSGGGLVKAASGGSVASLLASTDLAYVGSFRLPTAWGYGHEGLAYNPTNDSLFIGSAAHEVGEMTIPTPSASTTFASLPQATIISGQVSTDPSEGNFGNIGTVPADGEHDRIGGLLVNATDGELIVNYFRTYGSNIAQSHLVRPVNLASTGSARMWYHVKGGDGRYWNGWTAGCMCHVPSEWQSALGATALTGQNTISLMSGDPGTVGSGEGRSGWGPTAFGFNIADLVGPSGTVVTASNLISYNKLHYFYGESGDMPGTTYSHWNQASRITGLVFPGGSTRSVLFFGRMGVGTYYYDVITDNIALDGTLCDLPGEEGRYWRYDPTLFLSNPNEHANLSWPYRLKVWAYDANDVAAVKAGSMNHYDIAPYGEWILDAPPWVPASASSPYYSTTNWTYTVYGAAFDPTSRRIYLETRGADYTGGERAVVVYQLPA